MKKKLNLINKNISNNASEWIQKYLFKVNKNKILLDLASGNGRHSIYAKSKGYKVVSADLDLIKLKNIPKINNLYKINVNFEKKYNWPFIDKCFDTIIVTNYLHREIFNKIINSLKRNGLLIYETFSVENKMFGKPNNQKFLLKPQELFYLAKNNQMKILNYEEIIINFPIKKAIQRIYAKKL
tara:strand:- start:5206 stop:5754 length:549 start_codon:yes stop_codon:yes gene_type:complete